MSNPAIITWLASTNAPRHVLTKGVKLNFQKSLMKTDELFARANSHDKVSMTNETGTPIKLAQTFVTKKKQLTKFSYLHEQMSWCPLGFGLYNVTGRHLNIQNNWNQFNYKPFGGLCTT